MKANRTHNPLTKRLYTLKEAAEYLGRPVWGVRTIVWSGQIPVVKPRGGRKIYIDVVDLNNFIERNKHTYQ